MIRRLVEAHYFQNQAHPNPARVRFWFQELWTPKLLMELRQRFPTAFRRATQTRPALKAAMPGEMELEKTLAAEEPAERESDRRYWLPLRAELEKLRHPKQR